MHHRVVLVVVEPDRQPLAQLTSGGLVPQPGGQPGPDQVQLGLAHRALEPEHEAVVEIARVIDPVGVGDQRVGQRAQIQQLIPVGVVAGQPRHLDAEHDPDLAQADIGDQVLEPVPRRRLRTGAAQVGVDHHAPDGRASPAPPRARAARTGGPGSRCAPGPGSASTGAHTHTRPGPDAPRRSCPAPAPVTSLTVTSPPGLRGASARALRAISRASKASTCIRVTSGSPCHRRSGSAASGSGKASWTGAAATLMARK